MEYAWGVSVCNLLLSDELKTIYMHVICLRPVIVLMPLDFKSWLVWERLE